MSTWVSDETWSQLDPSGARLTRRERVFVGVVAVVGVLLLALGVAAGRAGLISPRIEAHTDTLSVTPGVRHYTESYLLDTNGTFDERLVSVTTTDPGIRIDVLTRLPLTIPSNGMRVLPLRIAITDCSKARDTAITHVLRVHRYGYLSAANWISRPVVKLLLSAAKGDFAACGYLFNVALGRLEGYVGRTFLSKS